MDLRFMNSCMSGRLLAALFLCLAADISAAEPPVRPYVAVFRRGAKTLAYVAAKHAAGVDSATFRTVRKTIEELKPQELILEGFYFENENMRRSYLAGVAACERADFAHCPEPMYAAQLAQEKGIPFDGGDPTDREIVAALARHGYSAVDVAGFYLARMVPEWRREGLLDRARFDAKADAFLRERLEMAHAPSKWEHKEFAVWYAKRAPAGKSPLDLTNEDVAPRSGKGETYFHSLSARIEEVRERRILEKIAAALGRSDRVLVVYGGSHLDAERAELARRYGPEEDSKPY